MENNNIFDINIFKNINKMPNEIIIKIYSYDNTFYEKYNNIIKEFKDII